MDPFFPPYRDRGVCGLVKTDKLPVYTNVFILQIAIYVIYRRYLSDSAGLYSPGPFICRDIVFAARIGISFDST